MLKLIDLTYYSHLEFDRPEQVIERHREALGFVSYMPQHLHLEMIKHANYEGFAEFEGVKFSFFRKKNRFWSIPFKTHRYLKKQQPDVILVQGLIFPLQVLFLRLALGRKRKIVVQHHGERPCRGPKALIQQLADRYIDAYLFTALGNATPWIRSRIISSWSKCHEVQEASTWLEKQDKQQAREKLGICGSFNFLWVGRLNANKDPLTVLKAFGQYLTINDRTRLFMIYQEESLLSAILAFIGANPGLEKTVLLVGPVDRQDLATWYSAADFYISASHREGSGYALLEAMACGCIPVVTDIPPFRKITGEGKYGFLFKAGDAGSLLACLTGLSGIDYADCSQATRQHFVRELSFPAIAESLSAVVTSLAGK